MMQDPAFQAYMKQITQSDKFKGAMKKTNETLKDPEKRKEMEEVVKTKLSEGEKELEKLEKLEQEELAKQKKKGGGKKKGGKKKKAASEDAGADDMPDMGSATISDDKDGDDEEKKKPSVKDKLKETGNSGDLNDGWF